MEHQEIFENRQDLSAIAASIEKVKAEVGKIIIGQTDMIDLLLAAMLSNGHVLIEGFPGLAKTLTAKLMARTISAEFKRIQFTPDLMPSDVLGTSVFNFKDSNFEFRKGPIFSNIILIDEINRAPAKTQAALFEVMEEKQVTIDGHQYDMNQPFMIMATQNPIDMEGTYRLPEAQMDRFIFKIAVDYPSFDEEVKILEGFHTMKNKNDINLVQPVLTEKEITEYRGLVQGLHIEPKLIHYITEIVQATRINRDIVIGASPRASLALLTGSKALAVIRGRDFVTPEDILEITKPVLAHRISLSPEKEMEGSSPGAVIHQITQSIEIPR